MSTFPAHSSPPTVDVVAELPWAGHALGSGSYRRIVVALLCAGVATFTALYSPQGVLPLVAGSMRVSEAQSALLVSAGTIGLAVGVLPWSWVADRVGRLPAMKAALVASTVFGLAWIVFPGFEGALVLRVLQGVALGGVPGLAITYLHDEVRPAEAAVAAGTYVSGTTLGGIAGRLVAGPIGQAWGWRWGVFTAWAVATVAAVAFAVIAPQARGFVRARGTSAADVARSALGHLRDAGMLVLYAQAFLLMGGLVAVYNFLGFRLEAAPFGMSAGVVSLLFLAYLSGTFCSRQAGILAMRFGRRPVITGMASLMAVGALLTLVNDLVSIVAGLVVLTGGFFGSHAIASGWVGARASRGRAQAAALYTLFYYLGSSVIGWGGGLVFESWAWAGIVLLVIGLALGAIALAVASAGWLREPAEAH
ncbi:MFS transporter [Kineosporia sp. J2-2]|uniref:MFS transporter n=1 Tax=Kineosporia corallincola TaxID=2835133 RepID=A0ABS5TBB7_9ACTN|nr:MFS transporter [Kineosporia corallincola]MBT0768372.1 MFS transporter [Kineosporia corallincola]